ncbi:5-formyltetrahydrofolate cyclo-ligase [Pseudonocardia sp. TRM90224]|uniref:5-formyltetrahydrofolate cyclo-ligase n=1 Tax=Pseudonocardia sp. TRM90224 TaxID=2812678 RepID=UPI001E4E6C28|nr:5-formyltetrahydrofolate cyclo-ligase [Pseudonocardia sp. TRM90224]
MTARAGGQPPLDALSVRAQKEFWRRHCLAARRALPTSIRAARAAMLTTGAVSLADRSLGPICAYLPVDIEPGSPAMVEALREAGHTVLLPVVPARPGPLEWARFDGLDALASGPLGLLQPVGRRLGPAMIAHAGLVLVPALAVDLAGRRLGRGGGYYDRTLPLASPDAPLVVVLNDEELVDELPSDDHDHPVTAALLAEAGITPLGNS